MRNKIVNRVSPVDHWGPCFPFRSLYEDIMYKWYPEDHHPIAPICHHIAQENHSIDTNIYTLSIIIIGIKQIIYKDFDIGETSMPKMCFLNNARFKVFHQCFSKFATHFLRSNKMGEVHLTRFVLRKKKVTEILHTIHYSDTSTITLSWCSQIAHIVQIYFTCLFMMIIIMIHTWYRVP